jgi:hypothetical protein
MSVIVLQRYAIDHDIKASTELKKEEIIEYILQNAKETKEAYFVPHSPEVYEKEVTEVSDEPLEEIIPEDVIEESPIIEEQPEIEQPEVEDAQIDEETEEEVIEASPDIDEPIEDVKTKVETEVEEVPTYKPVQQITQTVDISELVTEIRKA